MREEYGDDEGTSAAARHREALVTQMRKARRLLDDFAPDFVVIWGDDQYENFQEDIIPPFCVFAYDTFAPMPWAHAPARVNIWDEPKDTTLELRGHRHGAKALTQGLLTAGFDIAYAYKPLHQRTVHASLNAIMYLDYDRRGFTPGDPGELLWSPGHFPTRGAGSLAHELTDDQLDPPSPMPWRCYDLGAACARALAQSPWRVACLASSSWSHAFTLASTPPLPRH